jgi:hypothetical protein
MRHQDTASPVWRERMSVLALVMNSSALAMPFGLVLYNVLFTQPLKVDGIRVAETSFLLAIASVVLGVGGSRRVRVALLVGGVCLATCLVLVATRFAIL